MYPLLCSTVLYCALLYCTDCNLFGSFIPRIPPLGKKRLANVPPSDYSKMVLNQAKVKSVLSGDSLVLSSIENPDASAFCPWLTARHHICERRWARLFSSKSCIKSQILSANMDSFSSTMELNCQKKMIKEGWLKLREDAGRKEDSELALQQLDTLRYYEATARSEDKGLWQSSSGHIDIQHDMGNSQTFLDTWKGKTVDGLVERVLSGDRMLVRLIVSPTQHIQVMTLVAGIRAPATERVNPSNGQVAPAEPFGNEARHFVEERLLQRNVKLHILGLSPQNQLIASVIHPKGTIAKFILEAGLARCTDFHSTLLGSDMATLREAEKRAQHAKLGLFKDHVVKNNGSGGSLEATVTKIFSADQIYVQNKAGVEKRINISSIRGPRPTEPSESPFRDEAKEFLRKRLIGKHVRISIDGSRPGTEDYDAKEVATVTFNDKNIGLQLVQEGWASVIRHRRDDTDRAPNYDDLLAAQEKAKEEKKGMWSGKASKAKQYLDASETVQKAKLHVGGGRFVVLVPREGIKINFVLAGIRAPKSARNPTEKSEPFGKEAHDLAARRLSQRDVEIDVYNTDKVGGFIGELYINKESFGKILVEEGYATVHQHSAEQSGNSKELLAAEKRAKDARKGIWADWDPSVDEEEEEYEAANIKEDVTPIKREKDYRDVVVTNINEDGKLKLQIIGTGTSALETLMTQFKSFHLNPSNSAGLPGPPKAGDYVAAKFTEDGQWYRARIRANDRTAKEAEVVYIDYGNSEKIPWARLRPLSQPQFSTQKLRPQAVDAILTLLQFPTNKDYLDEAIDFITHNTAGRELVANVDYTAPDGTLYVTLFDAKSQNLADSINNDVVAAGLSMVPTKLKGWEKGFADVIKSLTQSQTQARQNRQGMWEYGDAYED
ncbi:hypothetical protein EYC84_003004 [Monilinia fructicola]|uniref:Probable endonuclease LCL3 n=1 Tax=Monilinia fructicola TaxID=38448 RepID=A0A5M9JXE1_MONFR|nr:hypothetical protein EYC84_003004 [Monilinia fructicola]